jgi:hypothetical protein
MVSIKDVNSAIITGNFTNDQLTSIIDAVKYARAQMAQQTKRLLMLGNTVKFTSNKNGVTYAGTVQKIAIKYVTVSTAKGMFKVPANMLEVAA